MKKSTVRSTPKSLEDLSQNYGAMLRRMVRHRVKYGITDEDAINEVWVRVLNAQVLTRFARARRRRRGLTFQSYFGAAVRNHMKNMFRTLDRRANSEDPALCEHNEFVFQCEWCRDSAPEIPSSLGQPPSDALAVVRADAHWRLSHLR